MPSITYRSHIPAAVAHGALYDAAFLQGYEAREEIFPRIAKVFSPEQSPAKDRVRKVGVVGVGVPDAVAEGQEIPTDSPLQGYESSLVYGKWAKAVEVTDEALADDQLGVLAAAIRHMGQTFAQWAEEKVAAVYNDAFAGATYRGGDGKPLCAEDHPRPDGGAALSNTIDDMLSVEALDLAVQAMWETKGPRGRLVRLTPRILLVPPKLWTLAARLVGSPGLPGSPDNDHNPLFGLGIQVVANPWLSASSGGSDTAWFLVDPVALDVSYYQRTPVVSEVVREGHRQTSRFQVSHRAAFGFNEWRGVFGSTGTGS